MDRHVRAIVSHRLPNAEELEAGCGDWLECCQAYIHKDDCPTTKPQSTTEPEDEHEWPSGCGYQGYEYGAGSYPDSICVEGRLFDADDCDDELRLYELIEYIPCPVCNPADAIDYWTERNQRGGASERAARTAAKLLVTDILKNRNLLTEAGQ